MSEGMKWLLLSMMVSLSRGRGCRESGNCICQDVDYREWKIQCPSDSNPKFIASFNIDTGKYQVECRDATSWSEFGYQYTLPLSSPWTNLTIQRCPLPDEPFDHIAKRFGLESVDYLRFTSHMNLSTTLTRQHLSLANLKTLNLSSNGLTELPSDLFRELQELQQLDLSYNLITVLPSDIFHGLSVLQRLDLNHNAIEFVHWRLFRDCTSLNQISLKGNLLTNLDSRTFRKMNRLYAIDLAENLLETLPSTAFEYVERLVLDISDNSLDSLPEELFSLTNLTDLTLSDNRGNLTTLPADLLNNLIKLEKVILIRNNLTYLPENIFWGSFFVKSIDLHENALSTLPKDIFRDSGALISLDLSDNGLKRIPEGLFRPLSELQRLNLARNEITSLSAHVFRNLVSLLDLNLGFNKIHFIHWNTFRELTKIRLIRLSHNSVHSLTWLSGEITEQFFGPTIQKLFLDHNNLFVSFSIDASDHEIPPNLRFVDLTYNQIPRVEVYGSSTGSLDVEFDLRHNNLNDIYIPDEIFSNVSILVDDNPLYCGCRIHESLQYMHKIEEPQSRKNPKIILGNASCSEPYWMTGTPVASLRFESFLCRANDNDLNVRCAEVCDCSWRPRDTTRIVDCSSRMIVEMPNELIKFVDKDGNEDHELRDISADDKIWWLKWRNSGVELNLTNNSLTKISPLNLSAYQYVETLILSHNHITELSFDVLPPRLETLHLDYNNLKRFEPVAWNALIDSTTLTKLSFVGNPWSCDSDTRRAVDSMKNNPRVELRYPIKKCLDQRNPWNIEKKSTLYVSYTIF